MLSGSVFQYCLKSTKNFKQISVLHGCSNQIPNNIEPKFVFRLCSNLNYVSSSVCKHNKTFLLKNIESTLLHLPRNISTSNLSYHSKENREKIINEHEKEGNEIDIGKGTWQEVYSGVLTTQLRLLKMFSIGSSVIGLSVQPIIYEKIGNSDIALVVTLASFIGFFTFITPALIHWVSKKYVTKLEYDPERDMYAATTLSFFLREKKLHFKIEDVIRPEIPGMFTSFLVKNRALFVDPSMFEDMEHYSRIMGFDKPIDFSIKNDEKS